MKRFIQSLLLLVICASIASVADEPKDAPKNLEANSASTKKATTEQNQPKTKKQKAEKQTTEKQKPAKQKQHHAKHKKGPPSASAVPTKPETIKAEPTSKVPETKSLPPTIR